jgi:DGQHR domain-containing protein
MNSNNLIEFKCLEITQPIGTFYIGVMNHNDLLEISYSDIRRIEKREVETYIGIERPLSPIRVKEIRQYVRNIDATFPTSVILAISSDDAFYDERKSLMKINRKKDVAKIIDGQHRIAGLEGFDNGVFQINVTIFIDMDMEDQAMTFSTINLTQTKVSKSLSYDLYDLTKARSPQKTCHNIAKLLNGEKGSPFENKILLLGRAERDYKGTLTQATFIDNLIRYISDNPLKDRDLLKRGKKLIEISEDESKRLIFRNQFINNKDVDITKNIWNYFKAVEMKWQKAWMGNTRGIILNRTTGFIALMRFLRPVYLKSKDDNGIINMNDILIIFNNIKLKNEDFTSNKYKPGGEGQKDLFEDFMKMSGLLM